MLGLRESNDRPNKLIEPQVSAPPVHNPEIYFPKIHPHFIFPFPSQSLMLFDFQEFSPPKFGMHSCLLYPSNMSSPS